MADRPDVDTSHDLRAHDDGSAAGELTPAHTLELGGLTVTMAFIAAKKERVAHQLSGLARVMEEVSPLSLRPSRVGDLQHA